MIEVVKCTICKHYLGDFRCKAFPKLILEEIAAGRKEHNEVLVGQVGTYVFVLKEQRSLVLA